MIKMYRATFLKTLSIALVFMIFTSCSVGMVASQASHKNNSKLYNSMTVAELVEIMGPPTNVRPDEKHETVQIYYYNVQQGSYVAVKALRIFMHVVLDIATLFMWELVAMPMEGIIADDYLRYEFFIEDGKVINFIQLASTR